MTTSQTNSGANRVEATEYSPNQAGRESEESKKIKKKNRKTTTTTATLTISSRNSDAPALFINLPKARKCLARISVLIAR